MSANGVAKRVKIDVGRLFERTPPNAPEAEAAVLGSMILDHECIDEVASLLIADDFYRAGHAAIFDAIVAVGRGAGRVDMVLLNERLKDAEALGGVGGVEYLLELAESVPSSASVGYYANIVRDKSRLRKLVSLHGKALHEIFHLPGGEMLHAEDAIDRLSQAVFELADDRAEVEVKSVGDLLAEVRREVDERAENPSAGGGIRCGFAELDEMLDGFKPGQVVVLGGRPSQGKSALAANIAERIAVSGTPAAFFSLEMSALELARRTMASESGVPAQAMRRPASSFNADDWQALSQTVQRHRETPLYIVDAPGLTLDRFTATTRKLAHRKGVRFVVLDYLQLMEGPSSPNRQEAVAALSRGVKRVARQLNVCVLELSQLSREAEAGEGNPGIPKLKHLRESGSIEQDADVVIFLHRDDYYRRDTNTEPDRKAIIAIRKQRNGPVGNALLHFDAQRVRFGNPTPDDLRRWGVIQ